MRCTSPETVVHSAQSWRPPLGIGNPLQPAAAIGLGHLIARGFRGAGARLCGLDGTISACPRGRLVAWNVHAAQFPPPATEPRESTAEPDRNGRENVAARPSGCRCSGRRPRPARPWETPAGSRLRSTGRTSRPAPGAARSDRRTPRRLPAYLAHLASRLVATARTEMTCARPRAGRSASTTERSTSRRFPVSSSSDVSTVGPV